MSLTSKTREGLQFSIVQTPHVTFHQSALRRLSVRHVLKTQTEISHIALNLIESSTQISTELLMANLSFLLFLSFFLSSFFLNLFFNPTVQFISFFAL